MNADHDSVVDEELAARLAAYDDALAGGAMPADPDEAELPELRERLERGQACVELLQYLRPPKAPESNGGSKTSIIRPGGANRERAIPDPACPVHIGRFEIRRALGSGGFGIVYLAYDPALCREVALKIPRAGALADAECLARFQREARAAAGLDHPNLVPVHEAGQLGPVCYIALAYCPGNNLAEWLKQRTTPVPCDQAALLVLTLARAVQYAHVRGVLHRDLKPSNVLLSPIGDSQRPSATLPANEASLSSAWLPDGEAAFIPRVTDFGLARFPTTEQGQTQTGAVLGTPCYMAPEQAEGRTHDVSQATDVYALGAILYEVVTGRPPFWAETAVATLLQVKTAEPLAPGRLRPQLPRDLETICLKCLHKDPRKRYPSAEALAEDLRRFLTGWPILARPTSRTEQALKWARRRPALAATLLMLVMVTFLGVAGIFRQWQKTQEALVDEAWARRLAELLREEAQDAQLAERAARENSEIALYHHRVVLAHREWLAANVGRAAQLLDECRADLRDWEWRYVRRLCDNDLHTLRGHTAPVVGVAFSPDGKLLASAAGSWFTSEPGEVKVWDAQTGKLLWTGLGHDGPVMGVAFSPDGKQLASSSVSWSSTGGQIRLWNAATGKGQYVIRGFMGGVFSLAYSPDGRMLASGGADSVVRLWDLVAVKQLPMLKGHKGNVFGVAFSPDGRLLASSSWDGTAKLWDMTDRKVVRTLSGPVDLRSIAFSPDGKRVVASSYDHSPKIWDMASGELIHTYYGHSAATTHATFSPDGRWIASADTGGNVQIWNPQTGRILRTVRGHTGGVSAAVFSPEGRRLATVGVDRVVRIWDFTQEQDSMVLDPTGARNVIFSPDGKLLAAAGYKHSSGRRLEKRVRVWTAGEFSRPRVWTGHTDWVSCVAFAPQGGLLASGSGDKTVRLWDVVSGRTLLTLAGHEDAVTGVSFSPDGSRLASASLDSSVKLWDVGTGQLLPPELKNPYPVHDVAYLQDGRRLVAVGEQGMVQVWDTVTGKELHALHHHRDTVERALLSPDGRLLATAGKDQTICLWDMTAEPVTGRDVVPVRVLVGPSETEVITGLAFSLDSRRLASSGRDHSIRIWDVASGNETLTLRGHLDFVNGMAFSPNGRYLVSASSRNIRVWEGSDAAPTGQLERALPTEREGIVWHRQQADECQAAKPPNWWAIAFHVSRLVEAFPKDWRLRLRRVQAEVELGRWQAAVDDCTHCIETGATDPTPWLIQAIGRLQLGDQAAYRHSCRAILDRFGQIDRPAFANQAAWACALAPDSVVDLEPAIRLARMAMNAAPRDAAYHNTLGALLYRAGKFQEARLNLQEADRLCKGMNPEDWVFLAMIHHSLGEYTEAQRWLDKTARWLDAVDRNKLRPTDPPPPPVGRMTEIRLLHREAEQVLTDDGPDGE